MRHKPTRTNDRDREYKELQFLAVHVFDRMNELIHRNAPDWMFQRMEEESIALHDAISKAYRRKNHE